MPLLERDLGLSRRSVRRLRIGVLLRFGEEHHPIGDHLDPPSGLARGLVLPAAFREDAVNGDAIDIRWIDARCRGCVGCGGRCSLFAKAPGEVEQLRLDALSFAADLTIGTTVEIAASPRALRRGAMTGYGLALVALLIGAVVGHALGLHAGHANLGALLGLLAGTLLAGRLTKRLASAPRLVARPCPAPELEEGPLR